MQEDIRFPGITTRKAKAKKANAGPSTTPFANSRTASLRMTPFRGRVVATATATADPLRDDNKKGKINCNCKSKARTKAKAKAKAKCGDSSLRSE